MPTVCLIDGARRRRLVEMPDLRPEWLVPIPQPMQVSITEPPKMINYPVARFQRTTKTDGKGRVVYEQVLDA